MQPDDFRKILATPRVEKGVDGVKLEVKTLQLKARVKANTNKILPPSVSLQTESYRDRAKERRSGITDRSDDILVSIPRASSLDKNRRTALERIQNANIAKQQVETDAMHYVQNLTYTSFDLRSEPILVQNALRKRVLQAHVMHEGQSSFIWCLSLDTETFVNKLTRLNKQITLKSRGWTENPTIRLVVDALRKFKTSLIASVESIEVPDLGLLSDEEDIFADVGADYLLNISALDFLPAVTPNSELPQLGSSTISKELGSESPGSPIMGHLSESDDDMFLDYGIDSDSDDEPHTTLDANKQDSNRAKKKLKTDGSKFNRDFQLIDNTYKGLYGSSIKTKKGQ